jgi:hypothetical protein
MYEQLLTNLALEDMYISQVFEYYRRCYLENELSQQFVAKNQRVPNELRENECIGVCNRSIGDIVPCARTLSGGAIRGSLQHSGLITASGGELFRGCVVFPTFDSSGHVIEATGIRFAKRIRHWQNSTINWKKPKVNDYISDGVLMAQEAIYGKAY